MSKKNERITEFELDIHNLPPLSTKEQEVLNALAKNDDTSIDFSDIPLAQNLEQFYRPKKHMTTVRLDADVLAWLRSQGKGYQTKINSILRREMLTAMQGSK